MFDHYSVRSDRTMARRRRRRIALAAALVSSALTVTANAPATTVTANGASVLDPNYELIDFFSYTGTLTDIALGPGSGEFGNDLVLAEPGVFGGVFDGGLRRLRDLNGDGDAKDAGESELLLTNAMRAPLSIDFGYGGDLYALDYPSSSAIRFVYKITNAETPVLSQYTSNSIFNPNTLQFVPLDSGAELMTISASQAFTMFGGTTDGRIFSAPAAAAGTVAASEWSDGTNVTSGSPTGWWDLGYGRGTMPSGTFGPNWVIVTNQANTGLSVWAIKDVNADGDTDDAGEARLLIDDGSGYGEFVFGDDGIGYAATSTQVFRFEDKNGDGDFRDGVGGLDPGERELFIDGLPPAGRALELGSDGELYLTGAAAFGADAAVNVYLARPVDTDGDGVADIDDNCDDDPNPDQADNEGDGAGDVCDLDDDDDTVLDVDDNCPTIANSGQADGDGDGTGDVCDAVDDSDPDVVSLAPRRFFESRAGEVTFDGVGQPGRRVGAGETVRVQITGRGGIAAGSAGVVVNVTAVFPSGPGFVTVWDCVGDPPTASSLNYGPGQVVPNELIAKLSASGELCLFSLAETDLLVDVVGVVPADSALVSLAPRRFFESRAGEDTFDGQGRPGRRVGAGETVRVQVTGRGGVAAGSAGVVVNVTAVFPSGPGFVTVWDCVGDPPTASSLNYGPGQVVPNELVAKLSASGELCLFSLAETDVLVDVVGLVPAGSDVVSLVPARFFESRPGEATFDGGGRPQARVAAGSTVRVAVAGRGDVPAGASGVVVNVTAVFPSGPGFVTVWDCVGDPPTASSLNYGPGQVVPNELIAKLSTSGELCLFTLAETDLLVDVVGAIT